MFRARRILLSCAGKSVAGGRNGDAADMPLPLIPSPKYVFSARDVDSGGRMADVTLPKWGRSGQIF